MLLLSRLAICATAITAASAAVLPAAAEVVDISIIPEGLELIQVVPITDSSILVYALAEGYSAPGVVAARDDAATCGANSVTCSATNRAKATDCQILLVGISEKGDSLLGGYAYCLPGNICCASLSQQIPTFKYGALYNPGVAVFNACQDPAGLVSGFASSVFINGSCVTKQCLGTNVVCS